MSLHDTPRRFRHVANGTSVTMMFDEAGIPGPWSIWADPLHDGPVPGGLSDSQLMDVRMRHLAPPDPRQHNPVNDLREWRRAIERFDSYDELILWYEHDLFDQLNLIQLLTWIRGCVPADKLVTLICIDSFPGHPQFKGIGELTASEVASLLGVRQPVTDAQYELATRAWDAFRHSTPESLDELRRGKTSPLPYLADAITRFLQEYPWTRDGLSRSERRLLELAASGRMSLTTAFPRMHDGEKAYYVSDTSLADLAIALSQTTPPLLAHTRDGHDHILHGSVTLTDSGRAVLARQMDRVAACGIDRWYGGVHLHASNDGWRWDERLQVITKQQS